MVCVILVEYKLCTHSCLLYSFPLVLFGDTLLLLSSRRRGGVHLELPRVRVLLGVRLLVDVPVVPIFRVSYCFTLPHICIRHFVINVINNIRTHFIISFYVICAVIFCSFCCIYVWLDPGTYTIAWFMSFYKPGVTGSYALGVCDPSCELWLSWVIYMHRLVRISWLCFIFLNWAL